MCINMFVGELDPMGWQNLMQQQTSEFRARGMNAHYTVEKGQPHRLETLPARKHTGFSICSNRRATVAGK